MRGVMVVGVVGDSEIVTQLGEKFLKIFFAVGCRSAGQKMARSRFHPMKSGVLEELKPQKRRRKTGENSPPTAAIKFDTISARTPPGESTSVGHSIGGLFISGEGPDETAAIADAAGFLKAI